MNTIYVVGHKNPDTDSIVAAMAYAALRNASGDREYTAARLDHCNDETKRVLARFGYEQPLRITDVRTQVADIDFDTPPTLNPSVTLHTAWNKMKESRFNTIPVINPDGTLYGTLSSSDIANYNMSTIDATAINSLPLFNLLGVIEGKAALYMRENGISEATVYHNNPNGTCGFCDRQVPALLPEGAKLTVVPPSNSVANNARAILVPKTYTGNSTIPSVK